MSFPPSHPILRKLLPLGFTLLVTLTVMVAIFGFGRTSIVNANSTDLSLVEGKYPKIIASKLDSCSLCHTSSIPSLNPYGAAYKAQGRNAAAFGLIEAVDSDGDGYTNLQEINALTFPGDPNDHPMVMPTMTKMPTLAPTATRTTAPTATRTTAPTATRTTAPTQTHTAVPPTATRTAAPTQTGTAVPPTATRTALPTQTGTAMPAPSATPPATKTSAPTPAPSATWTRTPGATRTPAPPSGPTATPVHWRRTPRPTPTCQSKSDDIFSWFSFLWKHDRCGGGDDYGDGAGD